VAGHDPNIPSHHSRNPGHPFLYVIAFYAHNVRRSHNLLSPVDGPLSNLFIGFTEISAAMLLKFLAVVYITPIFSVPGVAIAMLGAWLSHVYMRAQIAIKREMSNAKAPVLGHFGASVAGLSVSVPTGDLGLV
jgi:hypothetical protein